MKYHCTHARDKKKASLATTYNARNGHFAFHIPVRRPKKEYLCTRYVPNWLSGIHVTERSHSGDKGSPISSSRSPWKNDRKKVDKVTQLESA